MNQVTISRLWTASGKRYQIMPGGMKPGASQYIDRDYTFNQMPHWLQGGTLIKTAGDDKMYEGLQPCLSFEVDRAANVYILHADKFTTKPVWLHAFTSTGEKVRRADSDEETMKGIFTVFARAYVPGTVRLGGCLPQGMLTPAFRETRGYTYCMYSVIVTAHDAE